MPKNSIFLFNFALNWENPSRQDGGWSFQFEFLRRGIPTPLPGTLRIDYLRLFACLMISFWKCIFRKIDWFTERPRPQYLLLCLASENRCVLDDGHRQITSLGHSGVPRESGLDLWPVAILELLPTIEAGLSSGPQEIQMQRSYPTQLWNASRAF